MKIVHLAQRFFPDGGGVEYHLDQITQRMIADGHAVTVICTASDATVPRYQKKDGVHIIRIPAFTGRSKTLEKIYQWWHITRLLPIVWQAHVVQVHDVFWWILPFSWLIPGSVYMTFHGYESEYGPTTAQKRWHQLAASLTDGSLAIGGFHSEWYGVSPTVVEYGAVNKADILGANHTSNFPSQCSLQVPLNIRQKEDNRFHLMYIGRLEKETGVGVLLEAVQALTDSEKKAITISVYGDGDCRKEFEKKAKDNQLPFIFYGFDANARSYIPLADCMYVSQYLAILESLVARKPVISYACSDFKTSVIQSTPYGLEIPIVDSAQSLTRVLQELLKNAHHNSITRLPYGVMSPNVYEWADAQTWEKMCSAYYSVWSTKDDAS